METSQKTLQKTVKRTVKIGRQKPKLLLVMWSETLILRLDKKLNGGHVASSTGLALYIGVGAGGTGG